MIQNMSVFICPHCSQLTHIFGSEGVRLQCLANSIDFLGDIPLHANICKDADCGRPTVVSEPSSARAQLFLGMAEVIGRKIGL